MLRFEPDVGASIRGLHGLAEEPGKSLCVTRVEVGSRLRRTATADRVGAWEGCFCYVTRFDDVEGS